MDNKQILEKAIRKALDSGWGDPSDDAEYIARTAIEKYDGHAHVFDIIFDHDFAKALWGSFNDGLRDDMPRLTFQTPYRLPDKWQFHLQQMVLADNPIEYLGEHLNG